VVEALLDAYPSATLEQDADGCLPLHEVAASSGCVDVLRAILDTSPEAAAMVDDKYHELPLHCACRAADNGQPKARARLPPRASPVKDQFGRRHPSVPQNRECRSQPRVLHPRHRRRLLCARAHYTVLCVAAPSPHGQPGCELSFGGNINASA
jgi:hypothetical protein